MPVEASVVITTFNSSGTIARCLSSLVNLDCSEAPRRIVVFDNASTDGTPEISSRFGCVRTVRSERNLGLARANNAAASLCGPGPVLFLNPDVVVLPGSLSRLGQFCSGSDRVGIAGPALTSSGGTPQSSARSFPDPAAIAARRTPFGSTRAGRAAALRHLTARRSEDGGAFRVDWLTGAAMWITSEGRESFGLMSEKYFLYFEDVELCWRAWEKGFEVWLVPDARMEHVPRRQSAGRPGRALWLHLRSMARFYQDHPGALIGRCPGAR